MLAYFIGGPEDLTKRVMRDAPPVIQFAVMPRLPVTPYVDPPVMSKVACHTVQYRLVSRYYDEQGNKIYIYQYESSY